MELSITGILIILLLLVIPLVLLHEFKVRILPRALRAIAKMIIYLALTGLCLKYLFEWDNLATSILWIIIMTIAGTVLTVSKARLSLKRNFLPVGAGIIAGALVVGLIVLCLALGVSTPFEARYFIPVFGLLIGSMVETNANALATYYMGLQHHNQLYYYLLGNGASHNAALTYFVKRAIEKAAIPNISRMAVQMVGLTPVLMWGMLLCGYSVVAAVEYQILFLAASFCASVVSMVVTLLIARKYSFFLSSDSSICMQTVNANSSCRQPTAGNNGRRSQCRKLL